MSSTSPSERVVRVFVSSTFRDMQRERDALVKRTFPELRRRCRDRRVELVEVDLRWGITEDQAERGDVIPICLSQIDRCRPYFIGLLGSRYGWVPDTFEQAVVEAWPWLLDYPGRSVTELEILHGALRSPADARHAFFYVRRAQADGQSDEADAAGLAGLGRRIRASGRPVRGYAGADDVAEKVLEDLWVAIDAEYPEDQVPDALARQTMAHEAFARGRRHVYVGQTEHLQRLDEHVRGDGGPLIVLGDAGTGKSALLAQWSHRYRPRPQTSQTQGVESGTFPLIAHFIEASGRSSNHVALMRRVIEELNREFDVGQEVPEAPDAVTVAFSDALHRTAARGRVVLILDGLDELESAGGARALVWLPATIPSNVRLIVSTESGPSLDELEHRGWPALRLDPLEPDERGELIAEYLGQYSKALAAEHASRIVAAEQASNPLFLRLLLEELRVYGDHDTLSAAIDGFLSAPTVPQLYDRILARYERDYEDRRPGLVGDAFSLIVTARDGLTETELRELLGTRNAPLPQSIWSPLYLAAEHALVDKSGFLSFDHEHIAEAVRRRYLSTPAAAVAANGRLADYFGVEAARYEEDVEPGEYFMARTLARVAKASKAEAREGAGRRAIEATLWHLARAGSWQALYDRLANLGFVTFAFRLTPHAVEEAWTILERDSDLRMIDAYARALEAPESYVSCLWSLSELMANRGHVQELVPLYRYLADFHSQGKYERDSEGGAVMNLGTALRATGDLDGALREFKRAEAIYRQRAVSCSYNREGLPEALVSEAEIFRIRGDLERAMTLFREAEQLCRRFDVPRILARALLGQVLVLEELEQSLERTGYLYEEVGQINRRLGVQDDLADWALKYGSALRKSDPRRALTLLREAATIDRRLGRREQLAKGLAQQATLLASVAAGWAPPIPGIAEAADGWSRRASELVAAAAEAWGAETFSYGFAQSLATVHNLLRDYDRALELLEVCEQGVRAVGEKALIAKALENRLGVLANRISLDDAPARQKEEDYRRLEATATEIRELGFWSARVAQVVQTATVRYERRPEQHAAVFEEQVEHALALGRRAAELLQQGEERLKAARTDTGCRGPRPTPGCFDEGFELSKQAAELLRLRGHKEALSSVVGAHARGLELLGRWEEAYPLRKEAVALCRETDDEGYLRWALQGLATCAINRAFELDEILDKGGAVDDGTLPLLVAWYRRAVAAFRELGDDEIVAHCYRRESRAIKNTGGDLRRALGLQDEAIRISRELGLARPLLASLGIRAEILFALGDAAGAEKALDEARQITSGLELS